MKQPRIYILDRSFPMISQNLEENMRNEVTVVILFSISLLFQVDKQVAADISEPLFLKNLPLPVYIEI